MKSAAIVEVVFAEWIRLRLYNKMQNKYFLFMKHFL
jgi:hypothetical protein